MSDQKFWVFSAGLLIGGFTLLCVRSDWTALFGFLACGAFSGLVMYLDPGRKDKVNPEEIRELHGKVVELADQIKALKFKIGIKG